MSSVHQFFDDAKQVVFIASIEIHWFLCFMLGQGEKKQSFWGDALVIASGAGLSHLVQVWRICGGQPLKWWKMQVMGVFWEDDWMSSFFGPNIDEAVCFGEGCYVWFLLHCRAYELVGGIDAC